MTRRFALWLLLSMSASVASAQDAARLFAHEAAVRLPGASGLVRLPLDAAVLSRARGDLGDLRLHDDHGVERPYLVESGTRSASGARVYSVTPTRLSRRIERGGSLAPIWREQLVLSPPPQVEGGRWTLWLRASSRRFVRDVFVYELGADQRRTEIARATIFRLARPALERAHVELPRIGEGSQLEIRIYGEGGYLEPRAELAVVRSPLQPATLSVPMRELSRQTRGGSTTVELERPPGVVADRLRVLSADRQFMRDVRVLDLGQGAPPREVGRARLFRVEELGGAEHVEVDLARAVGDRLRVEIDDGDSPPLRDLSFEAIVRQPALLFDSDGRPLTLRFGGGRVRAPRYDVQRFAGSGLGDRLLEADLPVAELGPVQPNPRFDDAPALRFAMRPGRRPDASRFRVRAPLEVRGALEGLSRVRLPATVLAAAREDLADVRIVDADGAQWPYLRGASVREPIPLSVVAIREDDDRSILTVRSDVERAVLERLELDTDAAWVSRDYALYSIDEAGARRRLAEGQLRREPRERGPLRVDFPARRIHALELEIVDGSESPLAVAEVRAYAVIPTLYLAAPDGDYSVLVGDEAAAAPQYEIARARDLVLSVHAIDARVGEAAPNAAWVPPSLWELPSWRAWLVWAVLGLAILFLGLLTIRVVRQETPEPKEPPTEDGAPSDEGSGPTKF